MLEMELPVDVCDRIGVQRTVLPELLEDAREQGPDTLANPIENIAYTIPKY